MFVREFKDTVKLVGNKDIYSVDLPPECKDWSVSGCEEYQVKGITDEYYQKLNMTIVRQVPKSQEVKRRVIDKATRSYKKDDSGAYVYQDYTIPTGSIAVLSPQDISLPFSRYKKDVDGFGYVDFIEKDGKLLFIYVIPREFLYKVNQIAIAISVKNMKNYQGVGFLTWDSGVIYIHAIPYSPNSKYTGTRILKTTRCLNCSKEFHTISDYWQSIGLIPNIGLCSLQSGENLCIKSTVTGYEGYTPVEPNPISFRNILGSEGDIQNESVERPI